jgi:hypothetical protein
VARTDSFPCLGSDFFSTSTRDEPFGNDSSSRSRCQTLCNKAKTQDALQDQRTKGSRGQSQGHGRYDDREYSEGNSLRVVHDEKAPQGEGSDDDWRQPTGKPRGIGRRDMEHRDNLKGDARDEQADPSEQSPSEMHIHQVKEARDTDPTVQGPDQQ